MIIKETKESQDELGWTGPWLTQGKDVEGTRRDNERRKERGRRDRRTRQRDSGKPNESKDEA